MSRKEYQIAYEASPKRKRKKRAYYKNNKNKINARSKAWYNKYPERVTIKAHWRWIFDSKNVHHKYYKDMPFYDCWNPNEGGSFDNAEEWIISNLGKRPKGFSLHIVEHALGFVPNNLEWASSRKQNREQIYKIIAQQRNRIKKLEARIVELENAQY